MNNKKLFRLFIDLIAKKKYMTRFIKELFDYDNFSDVNYIYRMVEEKDSIIIDIYDNISNNRFNRYIFKFSENKEEYTVYEINNVFVHNISVLNTHDNSNKLLKLGYLFNIEENKKIEYANTFLNYDIVECLKEVLNKK